MGECELFADKDVSSGQFFLEGDPGQEYIFMVQKWYTPKWLEEADSDQLPANTKDNNLGVLYQTMVNREVPEELIHTTRFDK